VTETRVYGRFDQFTDRVPDDLEQARDLLARLERRGRVSDEIATRAAYLDLLGLRPGERVLDVGCGSGVVTRDVAARIRPGGRVVGLDPNRAFLVVARELAGAAGVLEDVEFRHGDARALPFGDAEFDAALAVTALSHVPEGERAIPEMARVVRPGGRVGVFDLDTDSLIIAHPDRGMTRRMVAAHSDNGVTNGWLGRRLPGLFGAAGLERIEVRAFTPLERDPRGFYAGVAERAAEIAVQTGLVSEAERQQWLAELRAEADAGRFLAGRTHLFVWGVRPGAP
jgi:ubiquinone/menaquinone biosynthesis C-methylase UbiE